MSLKEIFKIAKQVAKDNLSTGVTAAAAVIAVGSAMAFGVEPTVLKGVLTGVGLLATKAVVGTLHVGYKELRNFDIGS